MILLLLWAAGCSSWFSPAPRPWVVVLEPPVVGSPARCGVAPETPGVHLSWTRDGAAAGDGGLLQDPGGPGAALTCTGSDGSRTEQRSAITAGTAGGNILLVLLDDVGVENVGAYAPRRAPPTPTLDRLAEQGVRFQNAWSAPVCTPTRVGVLAGTLPDRNGWGSAIAVDGSGLDLSTPTLPQALTGYASAAVGKWHITGTEAGLDAPQKLGFQRFAGSIGALNHGKDSGYFHWQRVEDGVMGWETTYATTYTADMALRFAEALPEPWFLWVAFHAPHMPYHKPPRPLLTGMTRDDGDTSPQYDAMLYAADRELGRLIEGLGPMRERTTIIVLGDNGTPEEAASPPFHRDRVKGTVYQGGIHVPLIVAGPGITGGRRVDTPVSYVDLFPTILELAGRSVDAETRSRIDGESLRSLLLSEGAEATWPDRMIYALTFDPNPAAGRPKTYDVAVTDGSYKLIRHLNGSEEVYRLPETFIEGPQLTRSELDKGEARAAVRDLRAALDVRRATGVVPLPAAAEGRAR
jgi:arylsulfatase A-like enzyme